MHSEELQALVSAGESEQIEYKRSTGQRTDAARTVSAMLNGRGGFVLFGVADNGEVVGQQVSAGTLTDIIRELGRIEPRPLLSPEVVPVDGDRAVVLIRVPSGGPAIYTFDGKPHVRRGPTTSVMMQEEYRQLLLNQMHPTSRWETQTAFEFGIQDLDAGQIALTADAALASGRLAHPVSRETPDLLRGLGLLQGERLLNAAVALFGKVDRLLPYYPQCLLRLAAFRGTDKSEFLDHRQVVGNAFELLREADIFIRTHVPVTGKIVPGLFERVDDPLYPPEALREALANALCHRDYAQPGGSVSLAIYDDRLEITNTGQLPFGISVDELSRPHASHPYNPLIAGVFYRRGIIEQWGRGTLKILELSARAGLASPMFEVRAGEVVVRFSPTAYVPPSVARHQLTALQQEILQVLAREGGLSSDRLRPLLSVAVSEKRALEELRTLTHLDLVQKLGVTRGVRWVVR
jgi:ATP-dependent DNA helicase RecG